MDRNTTLVTKNAWETETLGQKLAASLTMAKEGDALSPCILCLWGQLGSGKTTFVQGFAKGLGIAGRLLSPTFIIVRRYGLKGSIPFFYHIDLYRIEKDEDMNSLGLMEIFSDIHAIIAVEWPERLGAKIPKKRLDIRFEISGEEERKITMRDVS